MVLSGIILLGLVFRVYHLGALGFAGNEDYTAIAVMAILDKQIPEFPSGVIFQRSPLLLYSSAFLVKLFGFSEVVLRLPSVLFSTVSILVIYLLGKRLIGSRNGLVAALLMAVSGWEVLMARTARMYSMLAFFMALSILLFYRANIEDCKWTKLATVVCIGIACTTHQIALALVPMFFCLALYLYPLKLRIGFMAVCIATVMVFSVANYQFENEHNDKWDLNVKQYLTKDELKKWENREPRIKNIMPLFHEIRSHYSTLFTAMTTVTACILLICFISLFKYPKDYLLVTGMLLIAIMLYSQQLVIAVAVLLVYLFLGRGLDVPKYQAKFLLLSSIVLAVGLLWSIFGYVHVVAPENIGPITSVKKLINLLLPYPLNFARIYIDLFPGLSLLVLLSCVIAAVNYLRNRQVTGLVLIALLFVIPIFIMGFHPSGRLRDRYAFYLNPFFLLLAAYAITWIWKSIGNFFHQRKINSLFPRIVSGAYLVALALGTEAGGAQRALAQATAQYGLNEKLHNRWNNKTYFHPDYQGTSVFVKENYRESDIVIVMDILAHYTYFPTVHHQLSVSNKRDAEGWIGVSRIGSVSELHKKFDQYKDRRIWIILSGIHIREFVADTEMSAMIKLIESRGSVPRYLGRDGLSHVYLIVNE